MQMLLCGRAHAPIKSWPVLGSPGRRGATQTKDSPRASDGKRATAPSLQRRLPFSGQKKKRRANPLTIISDGKPPNFSGILQKEKRRPGETREERNRQRASTRIPSGFSTIPAKNNGCRRARHAQNESRGKPDCRTREPKSKGRAEPGRRPNRGARGRKRPLPKRTDGHPTKSKSGTAQIEASQAGAEKSTGKRADAPKREAEFEQSERRTRTNKRST